MSVLLEQHAALLAASAISDEVAEQRGYWSASSPRELERLFGGQQRRLVPALVIPTIDARGEVAFCQLRPDTPRVVKGRARRYELPFQARMALDVPPAVRPALADPRVPLLVAEGARKADSAVSAGLMAIDLVGVWTWRGRNGDDGLTVLPDWEYVALNDRDVYLAFDSDAMTKREVHAALERLWRLLAARGARLRVIYLPSGDLGAKTGVDDYLAAGHTRDDLLALAVDELRPLPAATTAPKVAPPKVPAPPAGVLLAELERLLDRFVAWPSEHARLAIALFTMHTWAVDAAYVTPYIVLASPERRSGKTRTLEVLELVCREPILTASITPAALYQIVEAQRPTLLIDETDVLFNSRSERAEEIRGLINAGNHRGAKAVRGGKDGEARFYDVFSPKVLSGIDAGRLPDTIADRAIHVLMQRKPRVTRVERVRRRLLVAELEGLRDRLYAWAHEHVERLADYGVPVGELDELTDRQEEAWEPLLAIAALAGPDTYRRAVAAALALAERQAQTSEDTAHALLAAVRDKFEGEKVFSRELCKALNADDELNYATWHNGAGIRPNDLARHLRRYGVSSKEVRVDADHAKGYDIDDLRPAWERYLEDHSHDDVAHAFAQDAATAATSATRPGDRGGNVAAATATAATVAATGTPANSGRVAAVAAVAANDANARERSSLHRAEPACPNPEHRPSDWAPPGATTWTCGTCHPPADPAGVEWRDRLGIFRRPAGEAGH